MDDDEGPSLADVLDGRADALVTGDEPMASGDSVNQAGAAAQTDAKLFRAREVMLLQAVAEKYGSKIGTAEKLVSEFLGSEKEDLNTSNGHEIDDDLDGDQDEEIASKETKAVSGTSSLLERAKYIPLRLDLSERKLLRLCEAALNVSEYTDKVDILTWQSKSARIHEQIKDICAILSGLAVASDYNIGQKLIKDRTFAENSKYFAQVFEIGRRHKILNPERMRTDYGKLIHMLMDSQMEDIQRLLEFRLVKKISTAHDFLESRGALDLLKGPEAVLATSAISDRGGKSRSQVQHEVRAKEKAVKILIQKFQSTDLSRDEIERCLYSISDNSSFLYFNRDPIDHMITFLKKHFPENLSENDSRSLAIQAGVRGARLSHAHTRQYQFALQTMTLWREVMSDMFKLWCLAEEDLLAQGNYYSLRNTGQGLNRVQSAPRISRAMGEIIHRVQSKLGGWVGSSVVHLGDHNVPNSLTFIDKYTQVPRILSPLVNVIEAIPRVAASSPHVANMISAAHNSVLDCQLDILQDFFRHAFDGSGADNFYDAGSCIDGRLTSAWNWCNKIDKKKYYPVFKLCGFTGFDGNFKS